MIRFILGILLLTFLGAVGVFALQNTQSIAIRFLTWSVSAPLALMIVASYLLGMLSGWNVIAFLRHSIRGVSDTTKRRGA